MIVNSGEWADGMLALQDRNRTGGDCRRLLGTVGILLVRDQKESVICKDRCLLSFKKEYTEKQRAGAALKNICIEN